MAKFKIGDEVRVKGSRKVEPKPAKSPTACIVTIGTGKELRLDSVHVDYATAKKQRDRLTAVFEGDFQVWQIKED